MHLTKAKPLEILVFTMNQTFKQVEFIFSTRIYTIPLSQNYTGEKSIFGPNHRFPPWCNFFLKTKYYALSLLSLANISCWTIRVFRFTGLTREWSFSNSHNFFDSRDHSQFAQISIFLDSMIDLTQDLIEEYEQ